MDAKAEAQKDFSEKSGQFRLWLGLLLPPVAWALQLQAVYSFSLYACLKGGFSPIHIASLIALILSLSGGFVAWRSWQQAGMNEPSKNAGPLSRSRFMAALGVLTGALFSLVIIAQWLPALIGVPCEK